jgi:hypothetical protein
MAEISRIFLSWLLSLKGFVSWSAIAPAIWSAVPSLPAEPPKSE